VSCSRKRASRATAAGLSKSLTHSTSLLSD
jgi:hypothetical protein